MDASLVLARTVDNPGIGTLHVEKGSRKDAKVAMYVYTERGATVLFRVWDNTETVVIRVIDLYRGQKMATGMTFSQHLVTGKYLGRLRAAILLEEGKKIVMLREDETNGE